MDIKQINTSYNKALNTHNYYQNLMQKEFSLRLLQSYSPITFNEISFNISQIEFENLWKIVDTMQELRFKNNLNIGLNGFLTKEEFEIFRKISNFIFLFSTLLGFPSTAKNSLTNALISYRNLKNKLNKNTKIIEWGPGSGILGLILLLDGYKYDSVEISHSFYIYQSVLNETFCKYFSIPYVSKKYTAYEYHNLKKDQHDYNLLIANHMLNEMDDNCLNYNIKKLNNDIEIFFEGSGYRSDKKNSHFLKFFNKYDFRLYSYINIQKNEYYMGFLKKNSKQINLFPILERNLISYTKKIIFYLINRPIDEYFDVTNHKTKNWTFSDNKEDSGFIDFSGINVFLEKHFPNINESMDDSFMAP